MPSNGSYNRLIRDARTGDREAFDALARDHRPRVAAVLRQRWAALRDQDIDDVLQETCLRAFRAIDGFHPPEDTELPDDPEPPNSRDSGGAESDAFFRWLSGVAMNVAREHHKREGRRRHETIEAGDGEPPESGVSPSRALRREERMVRLEEALEALPPDYREVVKLVRLDGIPVKDVACRLDKTPNAISRMLLRASRKLRESFGDTQSFQLPARRLNPGQPNTNGDAHGA